jgi:outer membrane receptor protein involved in Fe transport
VDARWLPLGARLTLSGGVRIEGNDAFGTRAAPRFGVAYLLRKGDALWGATRLRGSVGWGIKEPTFIQSFGFSTDPCFPGNPDLRPEKSRTATFGIEQRLASDRVRISADGFLNQFRDMASFTFCVPGGPCPVAPPPGCGFGFGAYFNTDLARANGASLNVETRPVRWLTLSGNYTYTDSRVLEAPNAFDPALVPGQRLLRRPPHAGNFLAGVAWRRVNGSFSARFVGPRVDSDFLGLGLTRNAGYARFDVAASVVLRREVAVFGRIENLFDKSYQENLGVPALGRNFRVGMRFTVGGE